jgi:hypothetical protein
MFAGAVGPHARRLGVPPGSLQVSKKVLLEFVSAPVLAVPEVGRVPLQGDSAMTPGRMRFTGLFHGSQTGGTCVMRVGFAPKNADSGRGASIRSHLRLFARHVHWPVHNLGRSDPTHWGL